MMIEAVAKLVLFKAGEGLHIQKDPIRCECCGILCVKEAWKLSTGHTVGKECASKLTGYRLDSRVKLTKAQIAFLQSVGATDRFGRF